MIPCSNKFCEPTVCNIAGNKRNTELCDWVSHDYVSIILHSDEFAFDGVVNSWVHLDPNPLCNKILVEKLSIKRLCMMVTRDSENVVIPLLKVIAHKDGC